MKGGDKEAGKMKVRKWLSGYVRIRKVVFKTSHFSSQFDGYKKTISKSITAGPPDYGLRNGTMKESGFLALPRKGFRTAEDSFPVVLNQPFLGPLRQLGSVDPYALVP